MVRQRYARLYRSASIAIVTTAMRARPGGDAPEKDILPRMSLLTANLICIALVVIDLVARTWRIQWILWGTQHKISFIDSLALNAVGDAAAAITPNRIGGEPARLGGMILSGVPASAGLVAIAVETAVMWIVNIAVGAWLAVEYAPEWWQTAGPLLEHTFRHSWPWVVVLLLMGAGTWWLVRKYAPNLSHSMQRGTRRAGIYFRRMPAWPIIMGAVTTFVSVAARVSMLPVLAMTLPDPPDLGPLFFVSYGLIFSQLLLPTPSGGGVIEIGFLGGAVGDLGDNERELLVLWRFYATFLLIAIGVLLGVWRYGRVAAEKIFRGRATPDVLPEEDM